MTYKKLKEILTRNNIPEDVTLMSDSGWECDATDMDLIYYNEKLNVVVFRQKIYSGYEREYTEEKGWKALL